MQLVRKRASLLVVLVLCACSSKISYKVEYSDEPILYDSTINTCSLISINGEKIPYSDTSEITYKDVSVSCPYIDTKVIGTHKLTYVINGKDYTQAFKVIDITSPVIKGDTDINVIKGNDFDLSKHYTIHDNANPNPKVSILGTVDVNEIGEYNIKIKAIDASQNESFFDMVIHVIERKDVAIDQYEESDDPVQNHIPEVSKKPSNTQQETQPQLPAKPAEKSFLFSAGFTYDSAYTACNQYGKSLISQNIINGYTCTPIKVDDEYTGYHISFP